MPIFAKFLSTRIPSSSSSNQPRANCSPKYPLRIQQRTFIGLNDLVVIGGGIVGSATCFFANRLGAKCTLVERDTVASHASGFAFGGLHPRVAADDRSKMPEFAHRSFEEHLLLHQLLGEEYAVTSTWRQRRSFTLATSNEEAVFFKNSIDSEAEAASWLDQVELRKFEPKVSDEVLGAVAASNSAEVNAFSLTQGLAEASQASVHYDAIENIEMNAGVVKAVLTTNGQRIEGDSFVFAMGPWSSEMFAWFSLTIPVQPLKGQILRLKTQRRLIRNSVSIGSNYMATKPDGLLWVGTTEEQTGFNNTTSAAGREEILEFARKVIGSEFEYEVLQQTACLRPMSPDGEVILGLIPGTKNAFVGTGGGRKGILYGPYMGRCLAEQALLGESANQWPTLTVNRFLGSTVS